MSLSLSSTNLGVAAAGAGRGREGAGASGARTCNRPTHLWLRGSRYASHSRARVASTRLMSPHEVSRRRGMTRPSHSDPGGKPAVEKKGGEGRICACLEQARSAAAAAASGLTCHARRRVHVDRVEMLEGEGAGAGGRRRAGSQHVLHVRYVRAADDVLVACGVAWGGGEGARGVGRARRATPPHASPPNLRRLCRHHPRRRLEP